MKAIVLGLLVVVGISASEEETFENEDDHKYGTIIGIDLGTAYSCVGVYVNGRVEIIANEQGNRITPSYVAFTKDGERLIGDAAKNQLTLNPANTVFDVKRVIGRQFNETTVQEDIKLWWPLEVVARNNKPYFMLDVASKRTLFAAEQISAMLLHKMKEMAESYLGTRVTRALITVPAYFNDAQRQATKDAGFIAGLGVVRIINEPTAAAVAYGLDKISGERYILVFHLGSGTTDVSVLVIENGAVQVLATNGDSHLGGEDFDVSVMKHFINEYKRKTGKIVRKSDCALQKLRREVERAKRLLSTQKQVEIEVAKLFFGEEDFADTLTRAKFEELNMDLFKATIKPVQRVLNDANLTKDQVDEIVLVGGSTRIPKIRALISAFFNGKQPMRGVNPDEAVAYGAALYAAVIAGKEQTGELVLNDVIPMTVGIETTGGVMNKFILRNTIIPMTKTHRFSTATDDQPNVEIQVYEGDRDKTKDNHLLGKFVLDGIRPAPKGVPQIEVTFAIDVNGILLVTALDKNTGHTNSITITSDHNRLSHDDIDRMRIYNEQLANEDAKAKEVNAARNQLAAFAYALKNRLEDKEDLGNVLTNKELLILKKAADDEISWLDSQTNTTAINAKEVQRRRKRLETRVQTIVDTLPPDMREPPRLRRRHDRENGLRNEL